MNLRHWLKRLIPVVAVTGLVLVSMVLSSQALASDQHQEASDTYTVLAGFEDVSADGLAVEAFLPEDITIKVGDTVDWKFTVLEPHTVTFLAGEERPGEVVVLPDGRVAFNSMMILPAGDPGPYDGTTYINSGFPPPDAGPEGFTYSLTFTQPGTFPYVCLLHPFMTGSVTVLPDTAPPVFPPEIVEENGELQKQEFIEQMEDLRAQLGAPAVRSLGAGRTEHRVRAGISTQKVDLMHFDRPNISIRAGDTVTWVWEATGAPHNVMFVPQGQQPLPPLEVEPQEVGPPVFLINQTVFQPAGGNVFDPNELHNSGVKFGPMVPETPPGFTPTGPYSLTFNQPGTYTYLCSLHVDLGMTGTITVMQAVAIPPGVGDFAPTPIMGAAAGLAGLLLLASGGLLLRRRIKA